jgi:hypothetical protein
VSDPQDLQPGPAEVPQQAETQSGRLEIIEALHRMRVIERRFQFDDERSLEQQVDIIRPDDHPIICNRDPMLLHDVQPKFAQLVHQRVLTDPFQKPNAKRIQPLKNAAKNRSVTRLTSASSVCISVHPWLKTLAVRHEPRNLEPIAPPTGQHITKHEVGWTGIRFPAVHASASNSSSVTGPTSNASPGACEASPWVFATRTHPPCAENKPCHFA